MLNDIIAPYCTKVKKELGLPENQRTLLLWDAFKAQSTEKVIRELAIKQVVVPKNMTHLLQPLDLTTNASVKKMEKRAFSDYFTSTITEAVLQNPQRDVTTIEVDLKLSTLKSMHGKLMITVYDFLRKEQGKQIILSGRRAAGIAEAIKKARSTGVVPPVCLMEC